MSPTTQNPPEDLPIQETSTGCNEGIERVLATSLNESAGSGQLLIHDTTNGSSEIPIEEIELSDKNVTVTEDNDQTLATTTEPIVEELPPNAKITSQFVVPMPELGPDEEVFH